MWLCRGTDQINFTLNFSKGASQIVAQYYQFLRLGRAGYTKIMQNCHAVAMYLQKALEDTGYFTIISGRDPVPMLPLATFSLKSEFRLNGCARRLAATAAAAAIRTAERILFFDSLPRDMVIANARDMTYMGASSLKLSRR